MKRIHIPLLLIFLVVLASCSSNEPMVETSEQSLFESYKISKNTQGKYAFDVNLIDGAYTETYKDEATNTNKVFAFEGDGMLSHNKRAVNTLTLDNNKILIDVYENNVKKNTLWIEDENIALAKGVLAPEFLKSYSFEYLGGNEYVLDFEVNDNVTVNFEYNADENIHEIHLKEGINATSKFTKLYTKSSILPLRIDFVNYIQVDALARNVDEALYLLTRVPRMGTEKDGSSN